MDTPVDYLEFFPADYLGNPNITITPDGRRFSPKKVRNEVDYFEDDYHGSYDSSSDLQTYTAPSSQESAFKIIESPDLSKATPSESFSREESSDYFSTNEDTGSFFPDQAKTQDTHGFGDFEQKLGLVKKDVDKEEELPNKVIEENDDDDESFGSMKADFESNFNPGFSNFGNFGGQSYSTMSWGEKRRE